MEVRETMLPRLLSSVRRISQWSDMDELVDPWERKDTGENSHRGKTLAVRSHRFENKKERQTLIFPTLENAVCQCYTRYSM